MHSAATAWRWFCHGLLVKLLGLALGLVGLPVALAALLLLEQKLTSFENAAIWLGIGAAAVLLDVLGRCLCLAAPEPGWGRPMVGISIFSQFLAFAAAAGAIVLGNFALEQQGPLRTWGEALKAWLGVGIVTLIAMTLQLTAACLFMTVLQGVARYFDRPQLEKMAGWVVHLLVISFTSFTGLAALALGVFIVGLFLLWICIGFGIWIGGAMVVIPLMGVVAILLAILYVTYAWVLFLLRKAILEQLAMRTAFHEAD